MDVFCFMAESQGFSQLASRPAALRLRSRSALDTRLLQHPPDASAYDAALSGSNPRRFLLQTKRRLTDVFSFMAESQGFEPWVRLRTQHFECCTIDHSDNSPKVF